MKLQELVTPTPILEGVRLEIYEELLPLLVQEDDGGGGGEGGGDFGGGEVGEVDTGDRDDEPPRERSGGWWYRPGTFVGNGGGRWFMDLYNSVKQLVVATNIVNRMKQIGIPASGMARVQQAAKSAARNVNDLMSNPRATTTRIPTWTFDKPNTPKIKRWNEGFAHEFKKELAKLDEQQILD